MGVKSTVEVSRQEAIDRLVNLVSRLNLANLEAQYTHISNEQLALLLESANDAVHDGEGFENYVVR